MLKIRLMRIGTKQRPFYRVVVIDERSKRNGAYIELLGTYNPLTEPKEVKLKQDRIDHWVNMGAQMSDGFLRITGKAPQRPPRKPKKEKASPATPVAPAEAPAAESIAETTEEDVILNDSEGSLANASTSSNELRDSSAPPQNDKPEESEPKNERPA